MKNAVIRIAILLVCAAALELLTRTGIIPPLTMIPPSEMAVAMWNILAGGKMTADILFTLKNTALAIAISIVGGLVIGIGLHAVPRLRRVLDPPLASYYAVPTFVFYPLLVGLFGITAVPLIAIGAMSGIVAMIVNTAVGLDRVPAVLLKTAAAYRLGPLRRTFFITLPAAAPHLMTGVKLAVAFAVIGTIAGEFILSVAGMGKNVALAYNNFDNADMYGLLLLLLTAVIVVNMLLSMWEKRMHARWRRAS